MWVKEPIFIRSRRCTANMVSLYVSYHESRADLMMLDEPMVTESKVESQAPSCASILQSYLFKTYSTMIIYMLQGLSERRTAGLAMVAWNLRVCHVSRPHPRDQAYSCRKWKLDSHGTTIHHDIHRHRRKPMEPYFSRKGVVRMEPVLKGLITTMVHRLDSFRGTGSVVRLDHVFSAFSSDVITAICVGHNESTSLKHSNFDPEW